MPNPPFHDDPEMQALCPSHLPFPVVGIGASAGGIAALQRLLEQLPAAPGMAFVVVLHLSPRHESIADKILQRHTALKVLQVTRPTPLEPDHVYVISPRSRLSMNDGYLRVTEHERSFGRHTAIDYFFRTLAQVHGPHAIAIVLSGADADGSAGIARIRERGGVTMAQDPQDAEFASMPRAAIATGMVDVVLPAHALAGKLMQLGKDAEPLGLPREAPVGGSESGLPELDPGQLEALRDIMAILRGHTGHDFRHYKRATILRRIERRMQVHGLQTLSAYRDFLKEQTDERPRLLKDMLISVTNFFRDPEAFDSLQQRVLPRILEEPSARESIRVWSAGCATGEEAYSLAMAFGELPPAGPLQVFATDIDEDAIAAARMARYPQAVVADVSAQRLGRFFTMENAQQFRINKTIREKVLFARHNVLQDPPFSRLDLISCRNLLIYLERQVQLEVLETFHFALRPGGFLMLGSSESAEAASKLFTPVDKKNRIFRANPVSRTSVHFSAPGTAVGAESWREPLADMPREPRPSPVELLHRQALERHTPPSVLINAEAQILHSSEHVGRFLKHVGGTPSLNLLNQVLPELRLELRTAVSHAVQTGKAVDTRRVPLELPEGSISVSMTVRPIDAGTADDNCYLVLFVQSEHALAPPDPANPTTDPVVVQLERELRQAKERLQLTVEQSETSNEELKASNEELQSINEELRSATEELETSKEELQSINEELITVNAELKSKVEETGKVNDDLQNLIASTDIATIFIDRGMCIKRYTPRATDIFSIIPSDIGRSLLDITHRLRYDQLAADAASTFQSLRTTEREIGSKDGKWYIARMLPYRTTEDRIEGAVLTFIDITRRRQAEEESRQNQERMHWVADAALDYAIITMDLEGLVTSWNKGAERIFGYTEAEVLGQSGELIFTEQDRAQGAFEHELRVAREQGRAEDDRWHVRKDQVTIYCSGITTPLLQGGLHGYAKIARDVTSGKRLEHEREQLLQAEKASREAAQTASQLKDEFLAVMSHELKHPLNLILMNAELLAHTPDIGKRPQSSRAVDAIRHTVLHQAKIIDDLLDLSRINTGKLQLKPVPLDLRRSVQRIAEACAAEAAQRQVDLKLELPEQLPLTADEVRLEQIVWNLLNNALKFSQPGGVVQVAARRDGDHVELEVGDSGAGIEPALLAHIFEMFQQGRTRPTQGSGLGIGLALVKQLAELHGGGVKAYSAGHGQGARFVVRLPQQLPASTEPVAEEAPPSDLRGRRVLLVDDAVEVLAPFRELLQLEGGLVDVAQDGREALQLAQAQVYDIVLSDISMPELDGHELIRQLRALPGYERTLAIAVSGFGRLQDERKALQAGFDAHIGKPISMRTLLGALARIGRGRHD